MLELLEKENIVLMYIEAYDNKFIYMGPDSRIDSNSKLDKYFKLNGRLQ